MSAADPFEELREALDAGRAEALLERWRGLAADLRSAPTARALAALALLDLEQPAEADRLLASGPDAPADGDWLWARAEVDLARWRLAEARAGYARLAALAGDEASLALRRALLHELAEEAAEAGRELTEAARLDPGVPPVPRLDGGAFERLVEDAIEALPEPFRGRLEEVAVVVEPVPSAALASAAPDDTPPDALGLFVGHSDLERASESGGSPGPVIYLYQRNLERVVTDEKELAEQVRITLLHEFGHLLGFDEDGVDAMGLA